VDGFSNFIADAISFKAEFNPSLTMGGVFFNKVEENTRRFKKYYEIVKESIPEEYFIKSYVRKDVLISDAADEGKSIFELAPNSRSAKDYSKLCRELLTKIN
jgi:cellulose biosynthesis protein BcsQ